MITVDRANIDGKWITFTDDEDVKFLIKPFRTSLLTLRPDTNLTNIALQVSSMCLLDWKGIKDVNGEDVKFTKDNKEFLLDRSLRLVNFIYENAIVINNEMLNIAQKKT
jgi:hypothetical protein